MQRCKKMPSYNKFVNNGEKPKQSQATQLKMVEQLNKLFGGKDLRKKANA